MDIGSNNMEQRYPCLTVFVDGKAAATLGSGLRMLFVAACDGKNVVGFNSLGTMVCAPRSCFQINTVRSAAGVPLRWEIDEQSGHLLVCPSEDRPDEWVDLFPWAIYDKAYEKAMKAAKRGEVPEDEQWEIEEDDWGELENDDS
jgi:hypothetical protein